VGDAEIQNRSIKNIKAFTNKEFGGGFGKADTLPAGPAQSGTDVQIGNNIVIDGNTIGIWAVGDANVTAWNKTTKNKTVTAEVVLRPGNISVCSVSIQFTKSSQKKKLRGIIAGGRITAPNGTYDVWLVMSHSSGMTTYGWSYSVFGMAPRA
jgi:hypothetical protein